jgi:hypothetical protein
LSEIELTPFELHEQEFLGNPDVPGLIKLYEFLLDELQDHALAGVLDKIRPIQHRVTLIQADAPAEVLAALCRDPHREVRSVVATHPQITEEVCFRLCEDPERSVRLALRKNPACHAVIRASLTLREKPGEANRVRALQLLEIAWQARRSKLTPAELVDLIGEWTELDEETYTEAAAEDIARILAVLDAKLGKGPMPRKPRRKSPAKKRGKSVRAPKASARVKKATKKPVAKKKAAKKKATKKKATKKKATKKKARK